MIPDFCCWSDQTTNSCPMSRSFTFYEAKNLYVLKYGPKTRERTQPGNCWWSSVHMVFQIIWVPLSKEIGDLTGCKTLTLRQCSTQSLMKGCTTAHSSNPGTLEHCSHQFISFSLSSLISPYQASSDVACDWPVHAAGVQALWRVASTGAKSWSWVPWPWYCTRLTDTAYLSKAI